MDMPDDADFDAIGQAAQAALDKAAASTGKERDKLGLMNWGDVRLGDIVFCFTKSGDSWFVVEIGETLQGCFLASFMAYEIANKFPGVQIVVCPRGCYGPEDAPALAG